MGPNGVGKTNLLEALHVATQGFSPRTRAGGQLVRFGEETARITVCGKSASAAVTISVTLRWGGAKEIRLNGSAIGSAERLRLETPALVFTPDRLAVVKGSPAVRRAYFDRTLSRLFPSRASVSVEYGSALGQRNAALRRLAGGISSRAALEPWTSRLAALGMQLVEARRAAIDALSPAFTVRASELGLEGARLEYTGSAVSADDLDARLERDLERGMTSAGPHLDDVRVLAGERELRSFGSQGEQRLAVLSLLLAEADAIGARRDSSVLLLLDDVLSELDPDRRRILAGQIGNRGQALVTSTTRGALPTTPDQLLEVSPGTVREA